jgi:hypothetical protein
MVNSFSLLIYQCCKNKPITLQAINDKLQTINDKLKVYEPKRTS